jgi:hypothetical protein
MKVKIVIANHWTLILQTNPVVNKEKNQKINKIIKRRKNNNLNLKIVLLFSMLMI